MRNVLTLIALTSLTLFIFTGHSIADEDVLGPGDSIAVCHATGSASNPYVLIHPSASSGGPAGHGNHENDIFAGYYFQQNQNADVVYVEGRNEDRLHILHNDCITEDPEDPTDPVEPEEPTDPVDPTDPEEPTDPVDPVDVEYNLSAEYTKVCLPDGNAGVTVNFRNDSTDGNDEHGETIEAGDIGFEVYVDAEELYNDSLGNGESDTVEFIVEHGDTIDLVVNGLDTVLLSATIDTEDCDLPAPVEEEPADPAEPIETEDTTEVEAAEQVETTEATTEELPVTGNNPLLFALVGVALIGAGRYTLSLA